MVEWPSLAQSIRTSRRLSAKPGAVEGASRGALSGADIGWDSSGETLSPAQFAATLCMDQRRRWHEGERVTVEDYAREFPPLESDQELLLDLIYNEYLLRQQFDLRPREEEFIARYPTLADELSRLFAVHRAIESDDGFEPAKSRAVRVEWDGKVSAEDNTQRDGVVPARLGGYELLEEIGRGGMGVVYKARQPGTRRAVALKVILTGAFASAREVARFRGEAMAAAGLDHPGIVPVYEFGRDGQLFYYSMAYVEGENLACYLAGRKLAPSRAAELVRQIALAAHYAHTLGVTHRDLKPQNILIDRESRPRIVDFGLAKSESQEGSLTQTGQLLGTANYLAPEQALGEQMKIGPASDVFAIGAIFYELLSGQPPFSAPTVVAVLSKVVHEDPSRPRAVDPSIPRDLETICLKCLVKDPGGRYASARALADDLARCLEGRSILARSVPWWERSWLWCRRHPLIASLAAAIAVLAVLLAISNNALREQRDRAISNEQRAQETNRQARLHLAQAHLNEARSLRLSQHAGQRLLSLAAVAKATRLYQELGDASHEVVDLRNELVACLALDDIELEIAQPVDGSTLDPAQLALDADLERYATVNGAQVLEVHDIQTDEVLTAFAGEWLGLSELCFSPDGKHLAAVDRAAGGGRVLLWRVESVAAEPIFVGRCASGQSVLDFSADGETLAIVDQEGAVRLLEVASQQELERLVYDDFAAGGCRFQPSEEGMAPAARLAIWHDHIVRVIELDDLTHEDYIHESHQAIQHLAWSLGSDEFTTGLSDHNACIWHLDNSLEPYMTLRGHQSWVRRVAYRPNSHVLVTSSSDGTTRFWNAATGAELFVAGGYCLDFSRDGRSISGVLNDRLVKWRFVDARECTTLGTPNCYEAYLGAISPCGRWLATGAWNGVLLWDFPKREFVHSFHDGPVQTLTFSRDGLSVYVGTPEGLLRWTIDESDSWATATPIGPERIGGEEIACPVSVSFNDDGRILAVGQEGGSFLARSDASGQDYRFFHTLNADDVAVSPSGDYVATASRRDRRVAVYCLTDGSDLADAPLAHWTLSQEPNAIRFSPQGEWLLVGTGSKCLKFDCRSWQFVGRIACGPKFMGRFDFSHDGKTLAIGRTDFSIELVDAATLQTYATLPSKVPGPWVCFSPDGGQLACYGEDARAIVWDLQLVRQQLDELALGFRVDSN